MLWLGVSLLWGAVWLVCRDVCVRACVFPSFVSHFVVWLVCRDFVQDQLFAVFVEAKSTV